MIIVDNNIKFIDELDKKHKYSMDIFKYEKYKCANYVRNNHRCPKSRENKCHHGNNGD
jgi:hypothetical protein